MTGMGERFPPGNPRAPAVAVMHMLDVPDRLRRPPRDIAGIFDPSETVTRYEDIYRLVARRAGNAVCAS